MLRRSAQSILPRLGGSLAGSLQSPSLKDGVSCIVTSLNDASDNDTGRVSAAFLKLDFGRCTCSSARPTDGRDIPRSSVLPFLFFCMKPSNMQQ